MTFADEYAAYRKARLRGQPIPDDLAFLLAWKWGQPASDPLSDIGIDLLDGDDEPSVLDHGYLTAQDRANSDIMNNIAAIEAVSSHVAWVAETDEGGAIGYWLSPENLPISKAALVIYDTEGEFRLLEGSSFAAAILNEYGPYDPDAAAELRRFLATNGISIPDEVSDPVQSATPSDPARMHSAIYWALTGESD